MTRNGEDKKFLKEVYKLNLGNKHISLLNSKVNSYGDIVPGIGTPTDNEDITIKKAVTQQVKLVRDMLEANGAALSDKSFLDIQTQKDLRFTAL
jgi:hypothetical protein